MSVDFCVGIVCRETCTFKHVLRKKEIKKKKTNSSDVFVSRLDLAKQLQRWTFEFFSSHDATAHLMSECFTALEQILLTQQ